MRAAPCRWSLPPCIIPGRQLYRCRHGRGPHERGGRVQQARAQWIWHYVVAAYDLSGKSRQPLLDACRQLKPLLHDPTVRAGLFREGRDWPPTRQQARCGNAIAVGPVSCLRGNPTALPDGAGAKMTDRARIVDPRSLSTPARLQFRF